MLVVAWGRGRARRQVIFRKYLRYLLDQRIFDQDAVADVVQLKNACALSDETVRWHVQPKY